MKQCTPVAEGRKPNFTGLTGWVYEQTIRHCLTQELIAQGLSPIIEEQVPLYGRTKVDILVGRVAVEIKALGFFSKNDDKKYRAYRTKAEEKGWVYCYLTNSESHDPYRQTAISVFGKEHAFFLNTEGDWEKFVDFIARHSLSR